MSEYLFRPSALPLLMKSYKESNLTENQVQELIDLQNKPKLTDKQQERLFELTEKSRQPVELSKEAKGVAIETYLAIKENRIKIFTNKYTLKGNEQEDLSIATYSSYCQKFYEKNTKTYKNRWLIGTPDLVLEDKIVEIKTKYDRFTFSQTSKKDAEDKYYWQVQGYLFLTGKTKAELILVCVNSKEYTIFSEIKKEAYIQGIEDISEEYAELEKQIRHNHIYDDLTIKQKLKIISISRNDEDIEKIKKQIQKARQFLATYRPETY